MSRSRPCKDCRAEGIQTKRKAPHPGPRCATHHRLRRQQRRRRGHGAYIEQTYGITAKDYESIYEHQDSVCFICQRATGATKRLSVDHDHSCEEDHHHSQGCRKCVRGLLCTRCNQMLGHLRDDPEGFVRAIKYLVEPPAQTVLRWIYDGG